MHRYRIGPPYAYVDPGLEMYLLSRQLTRKMLKPTVSDRTTLPIGKTMLSPNVIASITCCTLFDGAYVSET